MQTLRQDVANSVCLGSKVRFLRGFQTRSVSTGVNNPPLQTANIENGYIKLISFNTLRIYKVYIIFLN